MRFSFILLAAGDSSRFKSNLPKPYQKIGEKTLIELSLNKIRQFKEFKKIVIVHNPTHIKFLKKINLKNISIINGGKTRQQSTYKALNYLKKCGSYDRVLIHDSARPNFSKNLIRKILTVSKKNKTVIPTLKLQDAIKEIEYKAYRRKLWLWLVIAALFIVNVYVISVMWKNDGRIVSRRTPLS